MREDWLLKLEREFAALREKGRYRSLKTYSGIDFGSNDYLGFATDPKLKKEAIEAFQSIALSSSSSRLLPGHHAEHLAAEQHFAHFVGTESALLFNSGYDANHALLTTLPTRHDLILYDERSHASIYDGIHASLAKSYRFTHNSASDLRELINRVQSDLGQIFIVVESVYSMDGNVAELKKIVETASEFGSVVIVDEAHATGVLGTNGEGLVKDTIERNNRIISVHTCGKALGAAGAFVCGSTTMTEYLVNKARQFIYTTALPPLIPFQIMNAVRRLESEGNMLVKQLREKSDFVRTALQQSLSKWSVMNGITPIISIIIGEDEEAMQASRKLETMGFDVPAIRPPTVPDGSARLRMNIRLCHSEEELRKIVTTMLNLEHQL